MYYVCTYIRYSELFFVCHVSSTCVMYVCIHAFVGHSMKTLTGCIDIAYIHVFIYMCMLRFLGTFVRTVSSRNMYVYIHVCIHIYVKRPYEGN